MNSEPLKVIIISPYYLDMLGLQTSFLLSCLKLKVPFFLTMTGKTSWLLFMLGRRESFNKYL